MKILTRALFHDFKAKFDLETEYAAELSAYTRTCAGARDPPNTRQTFTGPVPTASGAARITTFTLVRLRCSRSLMPGRQRSLTVLVPRAPPPSEKLLISTVSHNTC